MYFGRIFELLPKQKVWMIIISIGLLFLILIMGPESNFINYFWTPYNLQTYEEQLSGLLGGFIFIPGVLLILWIIRQLLFVLVNKRISQFP